MITALLDADVLLHRAASSAEAKYKFDEGQECVSVDFPAAKARMQELIQEWSRPMFPDKIVLCLSDPTGAYFRKTIYPPYKSHRSGHARPLLFKNLRSHVEEAYECQWRPGIEADDCLGILSTHPTKYPGTRIVVSTDKDLLQVPGLLYRPHRPTEGVQKVTAEAGDRWHLMQTLMGDSTDGFRGIPGIGPKKAEKILSTLLMLDTGRRRASDWEKVLNAYRLARLTPADALLQARVARILRAGDYHQEIGVRLWTPPEQQEKQ